MYKLHLAITFCSIKRNNVLTMKSLTFIFCALLVFSTQKLSAQNTVVQDTNEVIKLNKQGFGKLGGADTRAYPDLWFLSHIYGQGQESCSHWSRWKG